LAFVIAIIVVFIAIIVAVVIIVVIPFAASLAETWCIATETTRNPTLTEEVDEGQKEPSKDFFHRHEGHPNDGIGLLRRLTFLFALPFVLVPHAATETAKTPKGGHCQAQSHGHVTQVDGQQEGKLQRDTEPVPIHLPVVDVGSLALLATTDRGRDALEVEVGRALEAHVFFADGTHHVVAAILNLGDGNAAVATGLAALMDEGLRELFEVVRNPLFFGLLRIGASVAGVGVAVDAAKDVLARRTKHPVWTIVAFTTSAVADAGVVLRHVFGRDKVVAACARNQ